MCEAFEAHAEEWGGSSADMKVKVETCLPYAAVGRAVRELEVSRTPSELLLSLISLLRRGTLHTLHRTHSPAVNPANTESDFTQMRRFTPLTGLHKVQLPYTLRRKAVPEQLLRINFENFNFKGKKKTAC